MRVRGLQVHGAKVKQAAAGQRTAVNLVGVEVPEIERGMVLAPAERLHATQIVDAQVRMLADAARPLRSRQRERVHLGAAEVLARVQVLDAPPEIIPGEQGLAQLRFEAPMWRCSATDSSCVHTRRNGLLVAASFWIRSPPNTAREILQPFTSGSQSCARISRRHRCPVHGCRSGARPFGSDLIARTAWREEIAEAAIDRARATGVVIDAAGELLSPSIFKDLKQRVQDEINAHHSAEPLSRGLAKELLRGRVFKHSSAGIFRAVLAELEKESRLIVESDVVRRREHTRAVAGADAELRDRLGDDFPTSTGSRESCGIPNTKFPAGLGWR